MYIMLKLSIKKVLKISQNYVAVLSSFFSFGLKKSFYGCSFCHKLDSKIKSLNYDSYLWFILTIYKKVCKNRNRLEYPFLDEYFSYRIALLLLERLHKKQ